MSKETDRIRARLRNAVSRLRSLLGARGGSVGPEPPGGGTPPRSSYWSDSPLSGPVGDLFDRVPFAQRIADTIAQRKDDTSLVVGVYGKWGEGKTSLLNMIASALRGFSDIVVFPFNPWYFRSEEILVRAFFSQLAQALGRSLPTQSERFGKLLGEFGTYVSVASSTGERLTKIGERLSKTTLEDCRIRVEALLKETNKRVVVLVDDIDRLDHAEIQATFKLVKLSAGFRRLAYVLAMDDQHVAEALAERYGTGVLQSGRDFLEKIVQVPLRLPPPDPMSMRSLTFEGVDEAIRMGEVGLSEEDARLFANLFVRGFDARLTTPRQARRYGNAVMFALPAMKGEVNVLDLLLIEGIRVFYPELHQTIRSRQELFLGQSSDRSQTVGARQQVAREIDKAIGATDEDEKRGVRQVLEYLFPRIGSTGYGSDWDAIWATKQRVCSGEYFERYFTYSVSHRDVSDLKLGRMIERLTTLGAEDAARAFQEFVSRDAAPRAIRKLRFREDSIGVDSIENLCLALAQNGNLFPREQGLFSFAATAPQAAILISKLVRRRPQGDGRSALARRLVEMAKPLAFGAEIFQWLRSGTDKPDEERILTVESESEAGALLAARIRAASQQGSVLDEDGQSVPSLLWIWNQHGRQKGEVGAYLKEQFSGDDRRVTRLLLMFTAQAWGMMDGLPHRAELMRDNYNALIKLVDPEIIMAHLRRLYGTEIDAAEHHDGADLPIEEAVARQFSFLHRQVRLQESAASDSTHEQPDQPTKPQGGEVVTEEGLQLE